MAYSKTAVAYRDVLTTKYDLAARRQCRDIFLKRLRGPTILDAACGPGFDSDYFLRQGCEVFAIDFCTEFAQMVHARSPDVKIARMDMTELGFAEKRFDGIYCYGGFHHIPRRHAKRTLRGFCRALRDEGVLFLCLLQSLKYQHYTVRNWGEVVNNPAHFYYYSPSELRSVLQAAGLGSVEEFAITCPAYNRAPHLVERAASVFQVVARRI
jgi:SAM-dependent methyltransferase